MCVSQWRLCGGQARRGALVPRAWPGAGVVGPLKGVVCASPVGHTFVLNRFWQGQQCLSACKLCPGIVRVN